jgi:hypothetical protein
MGGFAASASAGAAPTGGSGPARGSGPEWGAGPGPGAGGSAGSNAKGGASHGGPAGSGTPAARPGLGCTATPVNPNATKQAKSLLCDLYSLYGNHGRSGQQETSWNNPANDVSCTRLLDSQPDEPVPSTAPVHADTHTVTRDQISNLRSGASGFRAREPATFRC